MEPQPESQSGSIQFFGLGDQRNRSKLSTMSISELISELRDTFLKRDFNRVEETLVAREATLKAEIEEKNLVIGLLQERIQFERLEKTKVELELKKVTGERGEKEIVNGFCSDGKKVVESEIGGERSKLVVDNGVASAVVKVEGENVGVLGEKKRLIGDSSNEDCLGSSGQTLGIGTVTDVRGSDQGARYSQATLNKKHTTSCVIRDTERQSSSGAIEKNLATRLTKPIGITPERDFNQVKETVVARGRMLKAEIEKKKEIGLVQEKNQFKRLERSGSDIQLKTVKTATRGGELVKNVGKNGNGLGFDGSKFVRVDLVHERCNSEGFKKRGVVNGNASALEGERVEVLAKKKRLVGELIKKDGLGASDNDRKSSQTKLATTRLVESNEIPKRKFASPRELVKNINNVLDGLNDDTSSSSSSSSSSSGEIDIDIPFRSLTSNKKMKTNGTNLGLKS